jgi:iron complex outermembrane receptor protein
MKYGYIFLTFFFSATLWAQSGVISGKLTTNEKEPAIGASVRIKGTSIGAAAKSDGSYRVEGVPQGLQTVVFSGVGYKTVERSVTVSDEPLVLNVVLDIDAVRAEDVVVYGASRRKQKLTEAPASVAVITPSELQRASTHGQLSKALDAQVGIDVAQSGANDFNINTRGFNNSINRRVLVLIDGRDPSTPLLNLQEWNSLATTLSDVQQLEVVRGPGSALFGANAYNGVINITTFAPRDVIGTRAAFTVGEFQTYRGDVRHAGAIGNFSYKINAGFARMRNETLVSRDTARGGVLEYAGLGIDRQPLRDEWLNNFTNVLTVRGDYDFNSDERLTLEGGISNSGNEVYVNTIGRILIPLVNKPFVRVAYNSPRLNVQGVWNRRFTPFPQPVLNTPASSSAEDSDDITAEAQYNDSFFENRLKTIVGLSHQWQRIETNVAGAEPLLSRGNLHNNFTGVYGQAEFQLLPNLQLVGAARLDFSTIIETRFSPKAALVWSPEPSHTLRFTVNQAFLRPSYPDFFRTSRLGAVNLAADVRRINDSLRAANGASFADTLNFSTVNRFSLGNAGLRPEESLSFEVGYKGVVSRSLFITADVYLNRRRNFISSPLSANAPLVFQPYRYSGSSAALNTFVNSTLTTALQNQRVNPIEFVVVNGVPTLAQAPINIGLIQEIGAELGVNYYLTEQLMLSANYAYLDASVLENAAPTQPILPNTSRHRINLAATYSVPNKYDIAATLRYVDGFPWLAGVQQGFVPSFAVVNLNGGYHLMPNWRIGVNVFNLLDRRYYEIFGGTVLRRYATVNMSYTF